MTDHSLSAIVLAAGEGTRMRSALPKPLHQLNGRAMVAHVLDALSVTGVGHVVVVVGYKAAEVIRTIEAEVPAGLEVSFAHQREQLGTGDATMVGLGGLDAEKENVTESVLVLPGDTPLVRGATLRDLARRHHERGNVVTLLSAVMEDPTGYGRVVRSESGNVTGIVEQTDLDIDQHQIREVNTSIYCFARALLESSLGQVSPTNAQGEYYLTDVIGVLANAGHAVGSVVVDDASEVAGVNDQEQLARAEDALRARTGA